MSDDRMRELEERYEDYIVYDRDGEKIGKVDDLFVDETDREEYIGVKMGLFGLSGTTLIPMEMARINDQERSIEVSDSKEHVKDAPTYSDDDDVTGDFEDRIRSHFGLEGMQTSTERGSYDRYSGAAAGGATAGTTGIGDNTMRGDQTEAARHSERPMGGAQDKDVHDERERDPLGQEEYRNREDMGRESSMGAADAGGATASGGIPDLETGEQSRDLDRGDLDRDDVGAGSMTRGHREEPGARPGEQGYQEGTSGRAGGIPDLETTGEPGRGDREDADVGDMTRGHREGVGREGGGEGFGASTSRGDDLDRGDFDRDRGDVAAGGMTGDRGDLGSSGQGMTRGDEGVQGSTGDEGYREGYREGIREGLREAGVLGEPDDRGDVDDRGGMEEEGYRGGGGRGEPGDREGLGASGSMGRSESAEEGMSRRGAGDPGGVGEEGMTGGDREVREGPVDRQEGAGEQEESGLTRVWRRVRR